MLNFVLTPSSGFVNSHLDVQFTVQFSKCDVAEIYFVNTITQEKLEILAVKNGTIQNESTIIHKNATEITGFINIFNHDKNNLKLNTIISVEIICYAKFILNNQSTNEEQKIVFYNESQSADSSIIPFDVEILNPQINLEQPQDLQLSIECNLEKKYELSIKSDQNDAVICPFEILTQPGNIKLSIPIEYIAAQLKLPINNYHKFSIYWTKFEGTNTVKFMNRKYIPLANTRIVFSGKNFIPIPQNRFGPGQNILSPDFVLSDRYFVPTYKTFSGFNDYSKNSVRMKKLTFFMHESQAMQSLDKTMHLLTNEQPLIQNIRRSIRHDQLVKTKIIADSSKPELQTFIPSYINRINESQGIQEFSAAKQTSVATKGCGCARQNK